MRFISHHIKSLRKPLGKPMFLLLLALSSLTGKAQSPSTTNQIKAVYLYNFTQFVTWPPNAFSSASSPFVIGVLGTDPFGSYLEKVVQGERVLGRPVEIIRYTKASEAKNCQILFINDEDPKAALQELAGTHVLTVSDQENFARNGGMIGFYAENTKIRLQINPKIAKEANLNISSKLLRIANLVD